MWGSDRADISFLASREINMGKQKIKLKETADTKAERQGSASTLKTTGHQTTEDELPGGFERAIRRAVRVNYLGEIDNMSETKYERNTLGESKKSG
ncbi:hypothetical protein JTB14_001267 [Gonioctena quinquepunctata]|nr:hypothetical protein JTB14_001267 [Gonioctena quinquepunctata]